MGGPWWRNRRQPETDSLTEISKSTKPAEIEVSHVNWIFGEQSRSIPRRRAEKPPAALGPKYYSRHHGNLQQTIHCELLLHTATL
ncbi:hypothetical protein PBY51_007778 [Eleginops maclovinus]|uniref:Uncharacterized protein n=1 Tax=Eleginops maclovinus TaxID=56733 RepID=A0AAN7X817_ELEMC|nr:hypothetical protein PBY51_007778 [Eleginops maclovinus]